MTTIFPEDDRQSKALGLAERNKMFRDLQPATEKTQTWRTGRDAFKDGQSDADNPHKKGQRRYEWFMGFYDASHQAKWPEWTMGFSPGAKPTV